MENMLKDVENRLGKRLIELLKKKGMDVDQIQDLLKDPYKLDRMAECAVVAAPS